MPYLKIKPSLRLVFTRRPLHRMCGFKNVFRLVIVQPLFCRGAFLNLVAEILRSDNTSSTTFFRAEVLEDC